MKISFIVPIYKKPLETLKKCLESLLGQTHKDREIICVFDGADPILESYVDKLAEEGKAKKVVIEHGGACKARNAGFKESDGEIISFWDADCYAEPMMSEVWVKYFNKYNNVDFVYSGYRFTDPQFPPFESEQFDPWTIEKYNYIASMFPCKRAKVVEWDESIDGLQDWDYWRRVVKGGARGLMIKGYGFSTEPPDKDSISGQTDKRVQRINAIRSKYGDKDCEIAVWGQRDQSVKIAKYLDADYFRNLFWKVHDYKMVLISGFDPQAFDQIIQAKGDAKVVLYWMGWDAYQLHNGPYGDVKRWMKVLDKYANVHLCDDKQTSDVLELLDIKSEVVHFPRQFGDVSKELPKAFKVFVFCDTTYDPFIETLIKAMPDVQFVRPVDDGQYPINDFTVFLQFTQNPRLEEGSKNALLNGRYLLSNVKEPYAGYIDLNVEPTKCLDSIINKIREIQAKNELNTKAQEFWMERTSPEKFKESILAYKAPILEVVQ